MLIVVLAVNLGVEGLHDLDYGPGLLAALVPVGNLLELLYHLEHVPAVFRHSELFSLRVVVESCADVLLVHLSLGLRMQI